MIGRVLLQYTFLVLVTAAGCSPSSPDLVVVLPEAPGVREGSPIEYLGIRVGEVSRVSFVRDTVGPPRVALELRLSRDSVPLRALDSVRVVNLGIFGDQAISIVPGPSNAPALRNGDTLLVAAEAVPPRPEFTKILDALAEQGRALQEKAGEDSSRSSPGAMRR